VQGEQRNKNGDDDDRGNENRSKLFCRLLCSCFISSPVCFSVVNERIDYIQREKGRGKEGEKKKRKEQVLTTKTLTTTFACLLSQHNDDDDDDDDHRDISTTYTMRYANSRGHGLELVRTMIDAAG
jgi:hypothetical protein